MPIYDSTLDYIFETDIMVEHGWDHPLHVRKRAQKEYLELRKKIKTLEQTTDMQHKTTISDLKLIGKLQQKNKELIKDAERLATAYKNAVEDIEKFALKNGISYLRVAGAKKLLIEHEDLMKKCNSKTI